MTRVRACLAFDWFGESDVLWQFCVSTCLLQGGMSDFLWKFLPAIAVWRSRGEFAFYFCFSENQFGTCEHRWIFTKYPTCPYLFWQFSQNVLVLCATSFSTFFFHLLGFFHFLSLFLQSLFLGFFWGQQSLFLFGLILPFSRNRMSHVI